MHKHTLVIFGNITFEENPNRAIVHDVENTMMLPLEVAEDIADKQMVNFYDAYLIPQLYKGVIVFDQLKV